MLRLFLFPIKIAFYFALFISGSFALFGSTIFKYSLQESVSYATNTKFKIGNVQWSITDPLNLKLLSINYRNQPLSVTIKSCQIKITTKFELQEFKIIPSIDISLDGVKSFYKMAPKPNGESAVHVTQSKGEQIQIENLASLLAPAKVIKDLKIKIKVNSSQATLEMPDKDQYQANNFDIEFNLNSVFAPMTWEFSSYLKLPFADFNSVPFSTSGKLDFKNGHIDIPTSVVSILEIPTAVVFNYGLNDKSMNLRTTTLINDLQTIPIRNKAIPITKWNGKFMLSSTLEKKNEQANLEGNLQFQVVNGLLKVDYKQEDLLVNGTAKIDVHGKVPFVGAQLGESELSWNLDLSQVEILMKNLLQKQVGVEFNSTGDLNYRKSVVINKASLKFHNLAMNLSGYINEDKSSDLKFNLLPMDLSGMEKIILPFAQAPLKGKLQLAGEVNGSLTKPSLMNIKIDNLKAKDVSGYVSYLGDKFTVRGPLALNLEGALAINSGALESGKFIGGLRGSDLEIKYKDLFAKPKGSPFVLNIEAQKNNDRLSIKDAKLVTAAGVIGVMGAVPLPPNYDMNLQFQIPNWDMSIMKSWMPKFSTDIPMGLIKSKLSFSGRINVAEPQKSDISTFGDLSIQLPSYEVVSSDKPVEKLDKNGKLKLPNAFLPSLDIIKNMNLNLNFAIDLLKWKNLAIQQILVTGKIAKSLFVGQVGIKKILTGQINLSRLQIPLLEEDPFLQFDIATQMIDADSAIAVFLPRWQGLVSGKTNMKLEGGSKLPSSPTFMEKLRLEGDILFKEGVLSTLPILQMAQKRMEQYSGIKDKVKALKSVDAKMKISTKFLFENQRIQLNDFDMEDSNLNLIHLNGKMDINLDIDLKGKILFVNSPVDGSFYEANRDGDGRLIVPVNITGSAKAPNLHMFDDTLKLMVANTVDYEKKNIYRNISGGVDKQSDKIRYDAENLLKEQKKKIEDEMRKRLEGLVK
jgi:hypothetical protein